MKPIFILLFSFVYSFSVLSQQHSKVSINLANNSLSEIAGLGIDVNEGLVKPGVVFETDLSSDEISKLNEAGIANEILIENVSMFYAERLLKAGSTRIDRNMFGLVYELEGSGAASPYQFFLTDSISHFVRGSLYFNFTPNNDSLEPVIEFIKQDIDHLINTFRWKNNSQPNS